jgi:hypothetical protein
MNTTVSFVLPEWMVWLLLFLIVLQCIDTALGAYLAWLKSRLAKRIEKGQQ